MLEASLQERLDRVRELLAHRDLDTLRKELAVMHVPDIAELILHLEKLDRMPVFRLLPKSISSEVFSHFEGEEQNMILGELTDEETRRLLASLAPDERVDLFEELPSKVTRRLFDLLSPEDLKEARRLLGYPPESVGRLMTPDYVSVKPDWTVVRALEHIREKGKDSETVNIAYVRDDAWHPIGVVDLRKIILANPDETIGNIMEKHFVTLSAFDDQEKAVEVMSEHDLFAVPVVGSGGDLIGIVTFDDVMDVAEEEVTEDFQKVSGIAPLDTSYANASVRTLYSRRIGWLVALVLINLASSGVIAAYEDTLQSAIALAFFIPLLIDSGGNAGAQAATLMIRSLSTGDVELVNWIRTISKELLVGVSLAFTLGIASAMLGVFRGGMEIGIIVGISMAGIVIVANMIGALLPYVLMRLRVDPAVASGPLITSVADVVGLFLYFSIATIVLGSLAA